jgi:hypothetical protein
VNGWNFLGSRDGRNVNSNSSEWVRVYWRYKASYEGKKIDTNQLGMEQKYEYACGKRQGAGL